MRNYRSSSIFDSSWLIGCGCMILFLILNAVAGAWSVNYILAVFDLSISQIGAVAIGLIAGEVTIPIAVIIWLLRLFGVHI